MKFDIYNKNNSGSKIAFFNMFENDSENISVIAKYNNLEVHLFNTDNSDFKKSLSYDKHLCLNNDSEFLNTYKYILDYIAENNIRICIFLGSGFPWTEKFLEKLRKYSYVACYFMDDPEGSEFTSRPYVKNFHFAFCGGIFFDSNNRIEEKYLEWGARKSKFIPIGAFPVKYAEPVNDYDKREVDLIYVGGCYLPKVLRMFKLKKYFGDRMLMYGRGWNVSSNGLKTLILRFIKFIYKIPQIEELSKDKFIELYQNTKIGFNVHMSYGPSNVRMYELPMNGVMQICDCEKGLSELYEIGNEVIAYDDIDDAIKKIEYYLNNDRERIRIARAGHERARNNYRAEISFKKIFDEILKDVRENYKQYN